MDGIVIPENIKTLSPDAQMMLAELVAGEADPFADFADDAAAGVEAEMTGAGAGRAAPEVDALFAVLSQLDAPPHMEEAEAEAEAGAVFFHEAIEGDDALDGAPDAADTEIKNAGRFGALRHKWQAKFSRQKTNKAQPVSRRRKNIRKIFEHETTASPLAKTVALSVLLVLVAALPPLINLAYIQPTITTNNDRLAKMTAFREKLAAQRKESEKMTAQIKAIEKRILGHGRHLKKQSDFEFLFGAFLAALERYNVTILNNTSQVDENKTTKIGRDAIAETMIVDMHLQTRFDIYRNIREIFMQQMGAVKIISETMSARPDSSLIDIKIKMGVTYLKGQ